MTRLTSEQGSAMVEFALVLTILLTLMFGVMDFSRALYAYHFLSNAAREATRYASVRGSSFAGVSCGTPPPVVFACGAATTDITDYVQSIVAPGVYVSGSANSSCATPSSVGQLNVCTTWPGTTPTGATCSTANGNNSPGCVAEVEVLYTYGFFLPFVSKDVSKVTMTSTSEVVIQQ
jgi:Flp pilus assembly protein TadG